MKVLLAVLMGLFVVGGAIAEPVPSSASTVTGWVYVNEGSATPSIDGARCLTEYGSRFDGYFRSAGNKISTAAGWDSINAADTTTTLMNSYYPTNGVDVVLVYGAFSGGATDSIEVVAVVRGYNQNNVLMSTYRDTIATANAGGGAIWLPFNTGLSTGLKYNVKLIGGADNGGKLGLGPMQLQAWRRVSYTTPRP